MIMKAELGTVIHTTLRIEDLIPSFTEKLKELQENNEYQDLIDEAEELIESGIKGSDDYHSDFCNQLFDALKDYAPPFCYFGNNEGDGSDFGFWISDDALEDARKECELMKVSDLSKVPKAIANMYVLLVNDHGNMTLYYKCPYELHEIWSVV